MNTENASSPLINGSKNNKRWSTIQCLSFSFVVAALVGFFSNLDRIISSDDDSPSSPELKSIVEIVTDRDDLTTLSSALSTANLIDTLNGDGPFTVFGPTNDAFDAITVPTDITTLTNILTYHVVDGDVLSTDLSNGLVVDTLNGDTITVFISEDGVFFYDSNGRISQVIDADLKGSNGVVHVVNSVLLPDGLLTDILSNIPFLSTLNAALIANGLDQVLSAPDGNFTMFAPTNDAIDAFTGNITSNVLLYHVLTDIYLSDDIPNKPTEVTTASGEILTVVKMDNEVFITDAVGRIAQVSVANVAAKNGVVHIIDILLAPTEFRSIVDLAVGRDDLSTLVGALSTAGLVDTLNGDGPFTVLAPTNNAFDAITVPTNVTVLTNILLYHVISGSILSTDLSNGLVAITLYGETVTVLLENGVFFYDSNGRISQVEEANIVGTNGVIHVIDSVLLPGGTVDDITQNVASLSTLNGALIANGLDQVLSDPAGTFTLFAPSNDAVSAFNGDVTGDVLTYHVLSTEYKSTDIPIGDTDLVTVNGAQLTVINNGTGIYVQDQANRTGAVTTANIAGINGVVHIIDIVLSPTAI